MSHRNLIALGAVIGLIAIGSGCAAKVVTDISVTESSVKVMYAHPQLFVTKTGIIQCDRADDGQLNNCRDLQIDWVKK